MSDVVAVTVRIMGKEYQIACPASQKPQLVNAAAYLENQMREVQAGSNASGERLAVIAGLNIAHELLDTISQGGGRAAAAPAEPDTVSQAEMVLDRFRQQRR